MKVKIPYELKLKFLTLEGLKEDTFSCSGKNHQLPGPIEYSLELDLSDEPELLEACIEWNRIVETYFKTSYKAARFDIASYIGVWPCEIRSDGTVIFRIDDVFPEKKNWKDWFVKEDMEYAPVFTTELLSNIRNP